MNPTQRTGSVELVDGYHLRNAEGHLVPRLDNVSFTLEGGFVLIHLPGAPTQLLSAPAIRLITCTD